MKLYSHRSAANKVCIKDSVCDVICDVITCCFWCCDMGKINASDTIMFEN